MQQILVSMKTITQTIDSKKPYIQGQKINLIEACKRESPITNSMEYFLATGNLVSKHGLGILQVKIQIKKLDILVSKHSI